MPWTERQHALLEAMGLRAWGQAVAEVAPPVTAGRVAWSEASADAESESGAKAAPFAPASRGTPAGLIV